MKKFLQIYIVAAIFLSIPPSFGQKRFGSNGAQNYPEWAKLTGKEREIWEECNDEMKATPWVSIDVHNAKVDAIEKKLATKYNLSVEEIVNILAKGAFEEAWQETGGDLEKDQKRKGRETYVNEEFGFAIHGPEAWSKQLGSPGEGVVYFVQDNNASFPRVVVMVQNVSEMKNILEYARSDIKRQEKKYKELKTPLEILEPPRRISINDMEGSKALFIISGLGSRSFKYIDCKFMKRNLVFSVVGISYTDDFEKYLKDFEETIQSFKFLN